MRTGVLCVIVTHDPWCPMAYGEGPTCCCQPRAQIVDQATFTELAARDMRNRAQRRAEAKRRRRERGGQ